MPATKKAPKKPAAKKPSTAEKSASKKPAAKKKAPPKPKAPAVVKHGENIDVPGGRLVGYRGMIRAEVRDPETRELIARVSFKENERKKAEDWIKAQS